MYTPPVPFAGRDTAASAEQRRRVAAGELPPRYGQPWGEPFFAAARPALTPGCRVLDVGAGRLPTLPIEERPPGCTYYGLDVSGAELEAAGPGAYDETVVADISAGTLPALAEFDLILSWQVLEHVPSTAAALDNMRACLRPGGRLVCQVSGSLAVFALLARIVPHPISSRLMHRLLGTAVEEKFPTRYDRCRRSQLEPLLATFSEHGIVPRYRAGTYFRFSRPLERAYLAYENWIERTGKAELATHYVIWAVR